MTYEQLLQRNIRKNQKLVELILKQAAKDIAKRIAKYRLRLPNVIADNTFYKMNLKLQTEIDSVLGVLHNNLEDTIENSIRESWELANLNRDNIANAFTKGIDLPGYLKTSMYQLNLPALDSFIGRAINGMNLSDRIWKLTKIKKYALEKYLASGISVGKSAARISIDIRDFEINPQKLFRRVRGEEGKLRLSKAAKMYHPGQGAYRSSYKNALRLAATETNIAYGMSDFQRRKQMPFVTGIEIHLSAAHPRPDLCDSMEGKYPKGFMFWGWHPLCMCIATDIKISKQEFFNYLDTGKINSQRYVRTIPKSATNYLNKNKKVIDGWKNKPYFIADNLNDNFELKESVLKV